MEFALKAAESFREVITSPKTDKRNYLWDTSGLNKSSGLNKKLKFLIDRLLHVFEETMSSNWKQIPKQLRDLFWEHN